MNNADDMLVREEEGPGLKPLCFCGGLSRAKARCYSG
jgi:hypothetical protein